MSTAKIKSEFNSRISSLEVSWTVELIKYSTNILFSIEVMLGWYNQIVRTNENLLLKRMKP